jgi:hypothetical protein
MAGVQPTSLPIQLRSTATDTVSYTFSLLNGNHVIALWTDGVAVDYDSGVAATLTVPGLSGQWVTGIDVLVGFQQQMVTSEAGGNLVIDGLVLKDYPMILRLGSTKSVFLPIVFRACPL